MKSITMKIVTWNTQWCKGLDDVISPARILDVAREQLDFDVLCLQEISVNYTGLTGTSAADQVAEIARLLPEYHVVFGAAVDEQPLGHPARQQFGNVIASRLPVLQIQKLALPSPIDPDNVLPGMARMALVCTVQAAWGPVHVVTTHLEYYNQAQRMAQSTALAQWHHLASQQARYPNPTSAAALNTPYQSKPDTSDTILCGDFNFTPDSPEYQAITQVDYGSGHLHDAWVQLHPGQPHPPTFRLYDQTYGPEPVSCDFFFISDSLRHRLQHLQVDTATQASDHQPVSLTLHAD